MVLLTINEPKQLISEAAVKSESPKRQKKPQNKCQQVLKYLKFSSISSSI